MNGPVHLEPGDRAEFVRALREALRSPDIAATLGHSDRQTSLDALHVQAMSEADIIATQAAPEYSALRRVRTAARQELSPRRDPGNGVLAALAVLTPILSATAAAIFLLLGYTFRLAGTQQPLADTLVRSGWTAAAVAALTFLATATALAITASKHRAEDRMRHLAEPGLNQARAAWRQALLERGLLPFLRRQAQPTTPSQAAPPAAPSPQRRPRLGYSSPDFSSPDFAGPATPSRD